MVQAKKMILYVIFSVYNLSVYNRIHYVVMAN